jgi:PAS domain S-box-containing protein
MVTPEHARTFYRNIFEHSVWGIFQTTADGRYIAANPALARIYGYGEPAELLAAMTNIEAQLYVHPERRGEFVRLTREHGVITGFESQVYRRDGTIIWISESCREVRDADGHLLYYEGVVEEVTRRKAAEEELRHAKEQAESVNRAMTEFLATMSHELRTPLNAIIGFAEMIRDEVHGPTGAPAYRDYAGDIWESGRHLLAIISDILDFVRVDSGMLKLDDEEFDLAALAQNVAHLLQRQAHAGGVALTGPATAASVVVRGDERRMKQVLLNLVGNAVKFTLPGGAVDVAFVPRDDAVELEVRDNGVGIAEADLGRVMEPFRQGDARLSRRFEGTGLGLAISDRLTRLQGGTLTLSSKLGAGTVVRLRLPRR